ncbi:MAG TPA: NAD(P)/FAD-dependent oxidoreductase [Acidimicrobiales bacterium]|nr:NAD(P)/FAD-dependent oxidoreductase [Acidimicrobiales bacterium]
MARVEHDAIIVGAGPNGLAAATTLAEGGASVLVLEAGETIGGGARTAELTLPGFRHDVCSAIHPTGVLSPYLSSLPLADHGLEWLHPEVQAAHPLGGDRAAVLLRSVEATAAALGDDRGYARVIGPLVDGWDDLAPHLLGPPRRLAARPVHATRFGARALLPATVTGRLFDGEPARALFAGVAAHIASRLDRPLTSAAGLVLTAAGHVGGWPVARGGSQSIVDALASHLATFPSHIETGHRVTDIDDLPPSKVVLLDVTPRQLLAIAGHRLPDRYRRRLASFRYGAGSFKLDYALDGPVPWTAEACRRAGTVHLGGTMAEIAAAEREVHLGRISDHPYVLVAQQSVVDPSVAPAGRHTLWAYTHVPNGSTVDMTSRIEDQIERAAPGFRDLVLARAARGPAEMEEHNANLVGGDIAGGAVDGLQAVFRPLIAFRPYRTPDAAVFLCSSSTPPGAGVHGMCGHWAARAALRAL